MRGSLSIRILIEILIVVLVIVVIITMASYATGKGHVISPDSIKAFFNMTG